MQIDGSRFLVTGGAGFIGSHVVDQLIAHGASEVVVYDNFARGKRTNLGNLLQNARVKIFPDGGDIREVDVLSRAMKNVDGVFHVAAMWLLHCKDYPRTAFDVNIQGTFNVLEACVNNGVKRLVFSSSASVYGDAVETPMKESHPFNNRNFYGATKISGEAICRAFFDRYGLDYVGLRYMNVYGPHQDQTAAYTGVIPIVLNKIEENVAPEVNGDGTQAYDFIDVRDVALANIRAMESSRSDDFYNVGTGIQTSIRELCELILEETDSSLKVKFNPYSMEDSRRMVQNRVGSIEKAEKELGFKFTVPLRAGIQDLIRWRLENPQAQNV